MADFRLPVRILYNRTDRGSSGKDDPFSILILIDLRGVLLRQNDERKYCIKKSTINRKKSLK